VSAGGYHHHLGFNTWKSKDGGPQPDGVAGLHHVAIRYPTRAGLADALRRLQSVDWPLRQTTDHITHEAIYISDPDGNDLELCWDRPFDQWPLDAQGHAIADPGRDLDLDDLLTEGQADGA
jgi:catechol 2,3-dioxygenase